MLSWNALFRCCLSNKNHSRYTHLAHSHRWSDSGLFRISPGRIQHNGANGADVPKQILCMWKNLRGNKALSDFGFGFFRFTHRQVNTETAVRWSLWAADRSFHGQAPHWLCDGPTEPYATVCITGLRPATCFCVHNVEMMIDHHTRCVCVCVVRESGALKVITKPSSEHLIAFVVCRS